MKKVSIFIVIIMIITGSFIISGCTRDKTVNHQALELHDYYKIEDAEDNLAALFYLGSNENEIKKTGDIILNKYNITADQLKEIEYEMVNVDNGSEWYLIVPKYQGTKIQVHSVKLDNQGNLITDKELITTDKPVVLQCNVSDIVPSSQVTVIFKDRTIIFNPSISLKDGKIQKFEGIFTE